MRISSQSPVGPPARSLEEEGRGKEIFSLGQLSVLTRAGVDQFEREVSLELPTHPTEDQLDLDTVAHHHAQQVVHVPSFGQADQLSIRRREKYFFLGGRGISILIVFY